MGGNDEAGGALFCFRETDGMHRYELTGSGLRAKRVLLEGQAVPKFAYPVQLEMQRGQWVPFRFEVGAKRIAVTFEKRSGAVNGPLSTQGGNSVLLRPGGKLRGLQLEVAQP